MLSALSGGFWDATILVCRFTIRLLAVAATASTTIAPMKKRRRIITSVLSCPRRNDARAEFNGTSNAHRHMTSIQIRRHELRFLPDCSRVLMPSFIPADRSPATPIIGRALALSEEETGRELEKVVREFSARHRDLDSLLLGIYRRGEGDVFFPRPLPPARPLFSCAPFLAEDRRRSPARCYPLILPP